MEVLFITSRKQSTLTLNLAAMNQEARGTSFRACKHWERNDIHYNLIMTTIT